MTRKQRLTLLGMSLGVAGAGCAGLERSGSSRIVGSTAPVRVEQAGVSVEVQVIDAEQARDIFDANLVKRGVQPLVLRIRNESAQTYRFEKAGIDPPCIPAATAARQAYENPVLVTGRVLNRAVFGSIRRIAVKSGGTTRPQPILNREIRESFVKEEIADADIGPHGSLEGFLYVRPLEPDGRLSVTLINTQTKEPLRFELRSPPSASAGSMRIARGTG